jgi:lipopolysaccharide export system permease protein
MFGASTVVFLFLFQFLVNHLNRFLGKGLSYWIIFQLIGYNLSWMFVFSIPIGILFGTLMAFGNLASNQEITVIKSGGMSLIKMMYPLIILGIFAGIFLYWFNDNILPETNHKAKVLLNDVTRKKPTFSIEAGQFSTDLEGYTILARAIDSTNGMLKGVTIYDNTRGMKINLVSADTGTIEFSADFTKFIIFLRHGEIHQIIPNKAVNFRKILFERYQIVVPAVGFAFERTNENMISRGDRELRISEMERIANDAQKNSDSAKARVENTLKEHFGFLMGETPKTGENSQANIPTQKILTKLDNLTTKKDSTKKKKETITWEYGLREVEKRINFLKANVVSDINQMIDFGKRANQYKVEIYKKYAIPFGCLLFVLVGCPLGIMTKRGNFGISAGISILFYIFYWISLIGGEKLADRGFLSPFTSMWMGNFIISIVAIIVLIRANNEGFSFRNIKFIKKLLSKKNN